MLTTISQGTRYVGVTTKMEYLPDIGPEEITPSETARYNKTATYFSTQ